MAKNIQHIVNSTSQLRATLTNHPVYTQIKSIDDLRLFMQYHVYAVWDFMSLLKSLQNNLTCTTVPWHPKGHASTRYLINEIVLGEECDVDMQGYRTSHFELYLAAMHQCGADTSGIAAFTTTLQQTGHFGEAFTVAGTPLAAQQFVTNTFNVINSNKAYLQAAVFTFGREDLIPSMFLPLVNDIGNNFPGRFAIFAYYLNRHIEVDGGHHSQLALEMTAQLCGNDEEKWEEAQVAVIQSLEKRVALWDGVCAAMQAKKNAPPYVK